MPEACHFFKKEHFLATASTISNVKVFKYGILGKGIVVCATVKKVMVFKGQISKGCVTPVFASILRSKNFDINRVNY